jgi:murein tripeptide amidase MpaA
MQHPSEDAGGFFIEGMIDLLLSEEYLSDSIRKKCVYHIIPMVNVDGFLKGMSRYNANMQDLNQQWFKTDGQPEVDAIKSWFLSYRERHGNVDLFIDIHSHGQHNPYNAVISEDPFFMQLTELLQKYWKVDYRRNQFNNSAAAYFSHMAGIPSATLELSQSHLGDEVYLTIEDYVRFGEGTVKAIYRHYNR